MTTLLLTNRFNPTKLFYFRLVLLFIIFSGFAYLIGKTDCNPPKQDIPDVAYKARAFLPITSDTAKPMQMKPIFNQLYYRKIDTLDMITGTYLGKSLSVDASDQLKQIFFRITRELRVDTLIRK